MASNTDRSWFARMTFLITLAVMLSKVLGLVRQQVTVALLGVGEQADAFQSGFRLANTLRELFAEGALSAAMVVVFTGLLAKGNREAAFRFAAQITNISLMLTGLIAALLFLVRTPLLSLYHQNDATLDLAADMFALSLPFLITLSVASVLMGFLNGQDRYRWPSLAPFFFNVVFLSSVWILWETLEIYGFPLAFVAGALGQLAIQIRPALKAGYRWRLSLGLGTPEMRQFLVVFLPILLIMAAPRLYGFITNGFATGMETGANAALIYAYFVVQLPLSVFVTGVSVVSLTRLTSHYSQTDREAFDALMSQSARQVMFYLVPSALGLAILGGPIAAWIYSDLIRLFGGTAPTAGGLAMIQQALSLYAVALIPMGLSVIFVRAFQATRVWLDPLLVALGGGGIFFASLWIGADRGVPAIPLITLSFSAVALLTMLLHAWRVKVRMGQLRLQGLGAALGRFGLAALPLVAVALGYHWLADQLSWGLRIVATPVSIGLAASLYALVLLWIKDPTMADLVAGLKRRGRS